MHNPSSLREERRSRKYNGSNMYIPVVSLIAVMVPTLYHSDVVTGYLERMVDSYYKVVGMVTAQQVYMVYISSKLYKRRHVIL